MFFRLFSFLADKTGGWKIFVQPKIMLGTMILGFGVVACNSSDKQKANNNSVISNKNQTENIKSVKCYEGNITDSTLLQDLPPPQILTNTTCYFTEIMIIPDCYQVGLEPDTITEENNQNIDNDTTIYKFVEEQASFPSGDNEWLNFINENFNFPIELSESAPTGKIYCSFVVEKSGEITNVRVAKGVHPLLDKEAIRVIELMPNWLPAKHKGKIVRSYFTLPVSYLSRDY